MSSPIWGSYINTLHDEKGTGQALDFGEKRKSTGCPQQRNWSLCTGSKRSSGPAQVHLHCTRFSKGFSARKLAGWGRRQTQCLAWAVPGTVSMQWCFPEAFVAHFGHVCLNASCTRSLNTACFKHGKTFVHVFLCLCPLSSHLSVWVLKTGAV